MACADFQRLLGATVADVAETGHAMRPRTDRSGPMDERLIYCPQCNRQVRIVLTSPIRDGQATLPDPPDVLCMDFQSQCTGSSCPVTGVSGIVMGVRLARSDLTPPDGWSTVRATCQGCQRSVDLEVLDGRRAYCPDCGTTNDWALLQGGADWGADGKAEQAR